VEIVHDADNLRIAFDRNVSLTVWTDAPTGGQLPLIAELTRPRVSEWPGGMFNFNLMLRGTPDFSSQVREEATELVKQNVSRLGTAHVITIDGLRGVAVRGFLSTILLLGRGGTSGKVFGSVEQAHPFALERLLRSDDIAWDEGSIASVTTAALAGL
jgi:hypothetical protein